MILCSCYIAVLNTQIRKWGVKMINVCCSLKVSFTLNEELTVIEGMENKTVSAPREHPFTMQSVGGQTLAVFTETSSGEFLFSSARFFLLWTPLQQDEALITIYDVVLWAFCDVKYLFALKPRGKFCVIRWWSRPPRCSSYSLLSSCTVFLLPALLVSVCCELSESEAVHSP